MLSRHVLTIADFQILIKSCSIESRNDPSPKNEVVHETKFSLKISYSYLTYVVGGTITTVFSWITFIINGIIPFSMLIHMNYVIVKTVRKSRKMFRTNTTSTDTNSSMQDLNKEMDVRQKTMKSAENQLTIMLLLVTMLFLILLIPTYIRFIYLTLLERDTPSKYASSMLFFHVTHKLYHSNNGINFFLYCISGRKFRNDLKEIFCPTRSSVPSSSTNDSISEMTLNSNSRSKQ